MSRSQLFRSWLCGGVALSFALVGCSEAPRAETTVDSEAPPPEAGVVATEPDLKVVPVRVDAACDSLSKTKQAFMDILKAAEGGDADAWSKAEAQLHELGLAAVPTLTERLGDKNGVARELAAMFLAQLGPDASSAADGLLKLLDDESSFARVNAAAALSTFDGQAQKVAPVLMSLLTDSDVNVRITTATSLRNIRPADNDDVRALSRLLTDSDSRVRAAAAVTLGEWGPVAASSIASLRSLGSDDDEQVRAAASRSIKLIDENVRANRITIPASATE
jgi:HEAT repeat protein